MNNSNSHLSGWAKAVMLLANLVFVVLDTTGLKKDSDILRVLVVTREGDELYHQIVRPLRHPTEPNEMYTGISQQDLDQAKPLAEQWEEIQKVLRGKYTLSYGMDFVQERLHDNAEAYHLTPVFLVGDCLYHLASQYCHRSNGIKLSAALAHVGFPRLIEQNAMSRAKAQMVLLEAVADGHPKKRPAVIPVAHHAYYAIEDLDDHPF